MEKKLGVPKNAEPTLKSLVTCSLKVLKLCFFPLFHIFYGCVGKEKYISLGNAYDLSHTIEYVLMEAIFAQIYNFIKVIGQFY